MGFFKYTGNVLRREVVTLCIRPMWWLLAIALPLVSFAFFAVIFREGVPRNLPIAVVDYDHTDLSRKLVQMFDATATSMVACEPSSMDEAEELMMCGDVEAIVLIPRDFEKDILSNAQTEVVSYISGLNISVNGVLSKDLQTVVTTFSSGIEIQLLMKKGLSEKMAYAQMMPLRFDSHVLFNPYINYSYYLVPSFMPMMLMIFALMATIFVVGTELKESTAGEWMAAAGGRILPALVGKLLPTTGAMMALCLLMDTIMYKWIGVPMRGSHLLLLAGSFLFILAYQSIGLLFITVLSNMRLALSLGGGYSVLAFTFSGFTFPLMAMSGAMRALSHLFPFTLYTGLFLDLGMRGAPAVHSLGYFGGLALFVIVPLLCLPRLKKIATDKRYWGRI